MVFHVTNYSKYMLLNIIPLHLFYSSNLYSSCLLAFKSCCSFYSLLSLHIQTQAYILCWTLIKKFFTMQYDLISPTVFWIVFQPQVDKNCKICLESYLLWWEHWWVGMGQNKKKSTYFLYRMVAWYQGNSRRSTKQKVNNTNSQIFEMDYPHLVHPYLNVNKILLHAKVNLPIVAKIIMFKNIRLNIAPDFLRMRKNIERLFLSNLL